MVGFLDSRLIIGTAVSGSGLHKGYTFQYGIGLDAGVS